jgi:RNA-directed DNA polymerase
MSNTSLKTTAEWHEINWRKLERCVYKLQKRIYQASNRGDVKTLRRLHSYVDEILVSKSISGTQGNSR